VRESLGNESLDDVGVETSQNKQRREGKQHVCYALSTMIHKKTLREDEDVVAK
jgi:hypothetical protein